MEPSRLWHGGGSAPSGRLSPIRVLTVDNNPLIREGIARVQSFFTPPDPSFAISQFNFDRDPKRMEAFSAVYDTHRDATLAEYRRRRA